jgi:hypothetical protein
MLTPRGAVDHETTSTVGATVLVFHIAREALDRTTAPYAALLLRVPKILTRSFPEILTTCR